MRLQGSQIKTTARLEGNQWIINGINAGPLPSEKQKCSESSALWRDKTSQEYCPNLCAGGCARGDNEHPLPNDGGQR